MKEIQGSFSLNQSFWFDTRDAGDIYWPIFGKAVEWDNKGQGVIK